MMAGVPVRLQMLEVVIGVLVVCSFRCRVACKVVLTVNVS